MKMYGSYSDEDLNDWQQFPQVASVLTSSLFRAWLLRRDENKAKQFPAIPLTKIEQVREEIEQLKHKNTDVEGYRWWNNAINNCLHELDKLIESEEK